MSVLAAVALAWIVLGAATAVLMVRRGHDVATWVGLAFVLGPVAPLIAIRSIGDERRAPRLVLSPGTDGHGFVDIVAGIDGSAEALAALQAAVDLHGENIGRLVLATVVPFDSEHDPGRRLALVSAAQIVAMLQSTTIELQGEPATALEMFAADEGLDMIVVGARGRGRSTSPLGSVTTRLASRSSVPVLVGPARSGDWRDPGRSPPDS